MARPPKITVDYFPFICKEGKTMYIIENNFKNDGFATWIKILRELASTDNHFLKLDKESDLMYLSAKCLVDINTLNSIINYLCISEEFDKDLWGKHKIIWCQKFIDSIQDAYKKRNNKPYTKELLLSSLGIHKPHKSDNKPLKSNLDTPVKPQRKEKNIKEKKNIEDEYIDIEILKTNYLLNTELVTAVCKSQKITKENLKSKLEDFNLHLVQTNKSQKNWNEYLNHFANWLRKQPLEERKNSTSKIPIG